MLTSNTVCLGDDDIVQKCGVNVSEQQSADAAKFTSLTELMTRPATPTKAGLSYVQTGKNDCLLMPFTEKGLTVCSHYVPHPDIHAFVTCNGDNCVICALGNQPEMKFLLPVFDCINREVVVLSMSLSMRPRALAPQVFPVLEVVKAGRAQVMSVSRGADNNFTVKAWDLPEDADTGEETIKQFLAEVESGRLKLDSVFMSIPNETLRVLPWIQENLRIRGLA